MFSIIQAGVLLSGAIAGLLGPRLATSFDWMTALVSVAVACAACAPVAQPLHRDIDQQRDRDARLTWSAAWDLWRLLGRNSAIHTLAAVSFGLSTVQLSLTSCLVAYAYLSSMENDNLTNQWFAGQPASAR